MSEASPSRTKTSPARPRLNVASGTRLRSGARSMPGTRRPSDIATLALRISVDELGTYDVELAEQPLEGVRITLERDQRRLAANLGSRRHPRAFSEQPELAEDVARPSVARCVSAPLSSLRNTSTLPDSTM